MNWVDKAWAYTINVPIAKNPDGTPKKVYNDFTEYFVDLINFAINIALALAVLVIVYGGFKYVTSGGDDAKAKDGKDLIVGAVVGLALLLLIKVIIPLLGLEGPPTN